MNIITRYVSRDYLRNGKLNIQGGSGSYQSVSSYGRITGNYLPATPNADGTYTVDLSKVLFTGNIVADGEVTAYGEGEAGGSGIDLIDNLESTRTDAALSANMGRALKNLIDNIDVSGVDLSGYYNKTEVDIKLLEYSKTSHTHTIANITDLATVLETKASTTDLTTHTNNTTIHITDEERTSWHSTNSNFNDWFYKDDDGYIHSRYTFIGDSEISAYGSGDSSDSEITVYDGLDSYDKTLALSANQGRVLKSLIDSIDISDFDLSGYYTSTEVDTLLAGYSKTSHTHNYLSLSGGTLTSTNVPLTINRDSVGAYTSIIFSSCGTAVGILGFDVAGEAVVRPNYTTNTEYYNLLHTGNYTDYVSKANHTHTFTSLTSKPTTLSGYGITDAATSSALSTHTGNSTVHITSTERTNWNKAYTNNHTHSNKSVLDGITSAKVSNWDSAYSKITDYFYIDDNGNLHTEYNFVSDGEVSAYGEGTGTGGGGTVDIIDNLTSTSTTAALSANMGRALKELIDSGGDIENFYNKAEIDSLLNTKSNTGHTHSYLPLSGGTITGAISMNSGTAINDTDGNGVFGVNLPTNRWTGVDINADAFGTITRATIIRSSGNNLYHYNGSSKYIILDASNYNTYCASAGHTHSYLPLSGGTLTSTNVPLNIDRTNGQFSSIMYKHNGVLQGILGFSTTGDLVVRPNCTDNAEYYNVIHSNNYTTYCATTDHTHSSIVTAGDNRNVATTPNSYVNKFIFQGLKTNTVIGSPSNDTYSYVLGLRGWAESSGGNSWELAFNNTGIFSRTGASTSWGTWQKLLTSSNYTDYCAKASHTHSYLPLSGGTLSNSLPQVLNINNPDRLPYIAFSNNGTVGCYFGGSANGYAFIQTGQASDTDYSVFRVHNNGKLEVTHKSDVYDVIAGKYGGTLKAPLIFDDTTAWLKSSSGKSYLGFGTNSTFTGAPTAAGAVLGSTDCPVTIRTNGNTLCHYRTDLNNRYTILDTYNYIDYVKNLKYGDSNKVNLSSAGWYRIAESTVASNYGARGFVTIRRVYNNLNNESYTFSIHSTYNGTQITQVGGLTKSHNITYVRTTHNANGTVYVDVYYNTTSNNQVSVNCVGDFKAVTPTKTTTTYTYTNQLMTGNGTISGSLMQSWGGYYFRDEEQDSAFNTSGINFGASSQLGKIAVNSSGGLGVYAQQNIYLRPASSTSSSGKGVTIDTNGNLACTGEVTAYSDKRLKTDIKPLEVRGELNPVTFKKDGKNSIGFIAQEVEEIYPELVMVDEESDEKYLSLNYAQLTAVLYAEIKELKERITKLENK